MSNRTPLIAGNWKMYKTTGEAVETAKKLVPLVSDASNVDIMIAPTFVSLTQLSEIFNNTAITLGAQNMHWEHEGAYTGEISADMLLSSGCKYVIIGHSERRQFFGETDESVNKKILSAQKAGLTSVMCIGESLSERESEKTFSVLDKQIQNGLNNVDFVDPKELVIAYEPVWAIGTGKTATSEQAQEVHLFIRSLIESIYKKQFAESIRILYGGSVKPGNIKELMTMPDVDGALVGGASLDAQSFGAIVNYK